MTTQTAPSGAAILAALEGLWQAMRRHHPELPPVVVVLASGSPQRANQALKLGHHAPERWTLRQLDPTASTNNLTEILISGEGLRGQASEVLATMLHECAHALAAARGVRDTSRQGRWHNEQFKALAEETLLKVRKDPAGRSGIGWSFTSITPEAEERYAAELTRLEAAMVIYRQREQVAQRGESKKSSNGVVMVCPNPFGDCGRRFRISLAAAGQGNIICGPCGEPFEIEEDDE